MLLFVVQGLASLVLKPMEESDLSPMDTSISAVAALLPSYHWLLVRLPSLPLFECVKMNICSDLRHVSSVDCIVQCAADIGTIFAMELSRFGMFDCRILFHNWFSPRDAMLARY